MRMRGFRSEIGAGNEKDAAVRVRQECIVASRAEFDSHPVVADRWHALYTRFQRETGRVAEERR